MTNEELIKKIETQIEFEGKSKSEYNVGRKDAYKNILILFKQLEVPEERVVSKKDKVEVPKFVADWIEVCKERAYLSDCLRGSFNYGQDNFKTEIITKDEDWLFEYDHADLVARAWLDGYEVTPETKMQITIKSYDKTELEIELPESEALELIEKLRGVEI